MSSVSTMRLPMRYDANDEDACRCSRAETRHGTSRRARIEVSSTRQPMVTALDWMKHDAGALHATVTKRGGLPRARVLFWHGPSSSKARDGDWRGQVCKYTLERGTDGQSRRQSKIKQRG